MWHRLSNAATKFGTNSRIVAQEHAWTVNGGCYLLWAFGWLLLFLTASGWLLRCSYFLEAVGHNGKVGAKGAKNDA